MVKLGGTIPARAVKLVDSATEALIIASWVRRHATPYQSVSSRYHVFEAIAREVRGQPILYLEFGVWEGASMRTWSRLLAGEDAALHGFDSFEGLPSDWNSANPAGTFSTGGTVPVICDPRVKFFAGWFDETLQSYEPPSHDVLILNLDADLYSSTRAVLDALQPLLIPGTYIYFDEFNDRDHEFRAFKEFVDRTGIALRTVSATPLLTNVAFQVASSSPQ